VYCRVTALIDWANRVTECKLMSNYNFYFGHPVVQLMFIKLTCLHDIRGVRGRRVRRRRKLLDELKKGEERILSFEEETPDRTMWIARFGRGFRPVVRQTAN